MNTTIEALQALYVALGGTAADVVNLVTIPDMINAIAALDIGGSGSSNFDPIIVEFTTDGEGNYSATISNDLTWNELIALFDEDDIPIIFGKYNGVLTSFMNLDRASQTRLTFLFMKATYNGSSVTFDRINWVNGTSITQSSGSVSCSFS